MGEPLQFVTWPLNPDTQSALPKWLADEQGTLPLTPWGDGPCEDCATGRNPRWTVASVFWNRIMGADRLRTLCIPCFAERVYAAGYAPVSFAVAPEFHWERATEYTRRREQAHWNTPTSTGKES
jgi:hypothetical protein